MSLKKTLAFIRDDLDSRQINVSFRIAPGEVGVTVDANCLIDRLIAESELRRQGILLSREVNADALCGV